MAPEIEAGEEHDQSADIWSLGQLMIQLLSDKAVSSDCVILEENDFIMNRPW